MTDADRAAWLLNWLEEWERTHCGAETMDGAYLKMTDANTPIARLLNWIEDALLWLGPWRLGFLAGGLMWFGAIAAICIALWGH